MTIEAAIYSRLSGFAGLSSLVSTRIYPAKAPQNPVAPYIVWRREGTDKINLLSSDTDISKARFEFECYSDSHDSAISVSNQIRLALQRFSGSVSGVSILDVMVEDQDSDYDDTENLFISTISVIITHRE